MERFAWPKNLSSSRKQDIKELLGGQNPTKKIRHLFDAHSQTGNNTAQPLYGEDLIVSFLGSFSNTLSPSSSAAGSYEVSQVPTNACVMSEVSEGSESIKPSSSAALPAGPFDQYRLQTLIESTSRYPWIYAIFWQFSFDGYHASASASAVPVLGWGDGYFKGEEDKSKGKAKMSASSAAEQEHRKRVLRELNSLIAGPTATAPDDAVDEEVTDTEWFFLVSMVQSFGNDGSFPGLALFNSSPIWVSGGDSLEYCGCKRAKQGRFFGLQTMVFLPVIGGVVELGSTELIFQSSDLMNVLKSISNLNPNSNYEN